MKQDNKDQKRPLTKLERAILDKLLEVPFQGSSEIKQQLVGATAWSTNDSDNYGSIYLGTTSNVKASVTSRVPVEGRTKDSDGVSVDIILHVVDGYIYELEIVKMDGSEILSPIEPGLITGQAS